MSVSIEKIKRYVNATFSRISGGFADKYTASQHIEIVNNLPMPSEGESGEYKKNQEEDVLSSEEEVGATLVSTQTVKSFYTAEPFNSPPVFSFGTRKKRYQKRDEPHLFEFQGEVSKLHNPKAYSDIVNKQYQVCPKALFKKTDLGRYEITDVVLTSATPRCSELTNEFARAFFIQQAITAKCGKWDGRSKEAMHPLNDTWVFHSRDLFDDEFFVHEGNFRGFMNHNIEEERARKNKERNILDRIKDNKFAFCPSFAATSCTPPVGAIVFGGDKAQPGQIRSESNVCSSLHAAYAQTEFVRHHLRDDHFQSLNSKP